MTCQRDCNLQFKGGVKCVALTSDDKYLITGSADQSIKIFDFETNQEVHHFIDAHQSTQENSFMISLE